MYNINFIYESEAAALYLRNDTYIPDSVKQKNKTFMMIDARGYSIDLSIYKIIDDIGSIKQLMSTHSFNLGILDINNKIIDVLKEIFGANVINKIKKDEPGYWVNLLNDINKAIEKTT